MSGEVGLKAINNKPVKALPSRDRACKLVYPIASCTRRIYSLNFNVFQHCKCNKKI